MTAPRKEQLAEGVTVWHGDCIEILPLVDAKIDVLITDPPYFLPVAHYATRRQFARTLSDVSILDFFFRNVFERVAPLVRDTGVYYVFCDGQSYPFFYVAMYPYVRRIVPLVWDKCVAVNGFHWRHQHELIIFAEGFETEPVKTGDGDVIRMRCEPVNDREHGAQKPVGLLERLLLKSPGLITLDPFMGSGTTGVAAINLGRHFVGIEIDQTYFDIACRRISEALKRPRLPFEEPRKVVQEEMTL